VERVVPAQERLDGHGAAGGEVDDGLVRQAQLVAVEGASQVAGERGLSGLARGGRCRRAHGVEGGCGPGPRGVREPGAERGPAGEHAAPFGERDGESVRFAALAQLLRP
jgi:hypothetical protein